MPILTSLTVFGSVVLFALWYVRSKNQMEDRVRALSAQRRALAEQDDPFTQRIMFPAVHGFVTRFMDLLPTSLISRSLAAAAAAASSEVLRTSNHRSTRSPIER